MSDLALLLSMTAVHWLAMASPGPNVLVVTQAAMQHTRRHGLATALGIAGAGLIWSSAVVLGLSALLALLPWLYEAIKLAGGVYLVYLGLRLWRDHGSVEAGVPTRGSLEEACLRGLLTNLTNPKSAAYFGSVFVLFMSPGMPGWVQAAAVGIVGGSSALWYGGLAVLLSTGAAQRFYARARGVINRLAGAAMAAFGLRLLLARD